MTWFIELWSYTWGGVRCLAPMGSSPSSKADALDSLVLKIYVEVLGGAGLRHTRLSQVEQVSTLGLANDKLNRKRKTSLYYCRVTGGLPGGHSEQYVSKKARPHQQ
uniref:Uncharacterized protein n=1 Tax=Timema shepardi TaxID=629360 RepID=A0A7R9ASL2_TIMSH|nr:unnamed protein product [Timema shepardi]